MSWCVRVSAVLTRQLQVGAGSRNGDREALGLSGGRGAGGAGSSWRGGCGRAQGGAACGGGAKRGGAALRTAVLGEPRAEVLGSGAGGGTCGGGAVSEAVPGAEPEDGAQRRGRRGGRDAI
ncbi:uncharacterized protein LOC131044195 [Cryptomeria japonica]|uniref:uncharacterized protein LOC131044195 n=1 Tax=Cryptomeria japonica TaxID=3369 RepID=UPI0025AB63C0|nr:uncharacterized protein LOC131044195 [Cryptomeria japonica]